MLVNLNAVLKKAQAEGYAVCAFNVENMEMIQAVIAAATDLSAPVILQTTPSTLRYAEPSLFFANVQVLAETAPIPVVMHLDHGNSFALASKAYRAGYSSIMIDGSKLPLEENIALTKSVVAMCRPADVSVEGELGCIGGKEDDLSADNIYTQPHEAVTFVERTGVDALAVAIGTAHGIYKDTPRLNMERLRQIHALMDIPLVLHGTSGVPDEAVRQCIANGICKVNYATDLRIAFTEGVRKALQAEQVYDPKKYLADGRELVYNYAAEKICMCGSAGKAEIF